MGDVFYFPLRKRVKARAAKVKLKVSLENKLTEEVLLVRVHS